MADDFTRAGDLLPGLVPISKTRKRARKQPRETLTLVSKRLMVAAAADPSEQDILFQHTILCQTGLPYRDQGMLDRWERSNGKASLLVTAGEVISPSTGTFERVGLPFGPKPRLILAHLNTEALRTESRDIDAAASLTRFVSHGLNMNPDGRTIKGIKNQLARLSACTIRIGLVSDGVHGRQMQGQIVSEFDVWLEKDLRQRVLWPSVIRLSSEYFQSLMSHAVPLDAGHLRALAHTSMGLDVYSWLAQRLHRMPEGKGSLVPWTALADQFGGGSYEQIRDFRRAFNVALRQVLTVYKRARVNSNSRGLTLWNSPPPVQKPIISVLKAVE